MIYLTLLTADLFKVASGSRILDFIFLEFCQIICKANLEDYSHQASSPNPETNRKEFRSSFFPALWVPQNLRGLGQKAISVSASLIDIDIYTQRDTYKFIDRYKYIYVYISTLLNTYIYMFVKVFFNSFLLNIERGKQELCVLLPYIHILFLQIFRCFHMYIFTRLQKYFFSSCLLNIEGGTVHSYCVCIFTFIFIL